MKTKTKSTHTQKTVTNNEGLGSESDKQFLPSDSKSPAVKPTAPRIDFARRRANRQLGTQDLLALLRSEAPRFYELAEVVGKWVWIQFSDRQPPTITSQLAEFGFHWNNKRQVWQHPCGPVTVDASPDDPRAKYGSHHPADLQPA